MDMIIFSLMLSTNKPYNKRHLNALHHKDKKVLKIYSY